MAQQACCQIGLTAVGVVQLAIGTFGDGIDGQIPPQQILFEGYLGGGIAGKSGIAMPLFAFDAGQGVLFSSLWMLEDGKVPANRLVTLSQQLLGASPDHHIVALPHLEPQ